MYTFKHSIFVFISVLYMKKNNIIHEKEQYNYIFNKKNLKSVQTETDVLIYKNYIIKLLHNKMLIILIK